MEDTIINKVALSPLITIDLKDFYPNDNEYMLFDIADYLYERLILKEKDFRQALQSLDIEKYQDKYVGIYCSEDVIIPQWSYLLIVTRLHPLAKNIFFGNKENIIQKIILDKIKNLDINLYKDKPIVIKGCSDVKIEIEAYITLVNQLMKVAKSIMYGEPCSTVPLFKRK
ncbi:MAG: DUF2480 family protein [Bacteroidia bacterium]